MSEAMMAKLHRIDFMIAEMSLLAGGMVYDSTLATMTGDQQRATRVQHQEDQMNDALRRLEFLTMRTAALAKAPADVHPHILRAAKTAASIEIIADGATTIASKTRAGQALNAAAVVKNNITAAAHAVQTMLEQATDAYIKCDAQAAQRAADGDDLVDTAYARGRRSLAASIQQQSDLAGGGITCLLILQQLELMGDGVVDMTRLVRTSRSN